MSQTQLYFSRFLGIQSGLLAHTKLGAIHREPSSRYLQISDLILLLA
jgi:hypothetical protein